MVTEKILQKYLGAFEQNMNKRFELVDKRFDNVDKEIGELHQDVYGLADQVQQNNIDIEDIKDSLAGMATKEELKEELRVVRVQMDRRFDVVIDKYEELKHDIIKPITKRLDRVELHLGI